MNKLNLGFLIVMLFVVFMVSCSNELVEAGEISEETELLIDKFELDESDIVVDPDYINTSAAKPNGGGNDICHNAQISYDYNCDGQFTATANVETGSWTCCFNKVLELKLYAQQQGWCYKTPNKNCLTYNCASAEDCDEENPEG